MVVDYPFITNDNWRKSSKTKKTTSRHSSSSSSSSSYLVEYILNPNSMYEIYIRTCEFKQVTVQVLVKVSSNYS